MEFLASALNEEPGNVRAAGANYSFVSRLNRASGRKFYASPLQVAPIVVATPSRYCNLAGKIGVCRRDSSLAAHFPHFGVSYFEVEVLCAPASALAAFKCDLTVGRMDCANDLASASCPEAISFFSSATVC